ncbi:DUF1810-domain-containing protein [Mollisia scopiformis]|uniref:DUF1810-domain-containing protein n=1 Tax=Mollisia scopiformis TaxID=149040 RepID=A0A194XEC6_MOLSC|nr:DUF1810-domain-containing protein [Mollisia scopiformis]KUJ18528.1 DUF1810-domain-containing protein [Mollisia scopiformis]
MGLDQFNLARFVARQDRDLLAPGIGVQLFGNYDQARRQVEGGTRTTQWMWWIYPFHLGNANSATAREFGITSLAEARAYLNHPVLGPRLVEMLEALENTPAATIQELLGGPTPIWQLHASLTLFLRADPDAQFFDFQAVLDQFYNGALSARAVRVLDEEEEADASV